MTAFGRSKMIFGEGDEAREISVEVRSVNSKSLDLSVKGFRGSTAYASAEEVIRPRLAAKGISRGKVDISVDIRTSRAPQIGLKVDTERAKEYIKMLRELADEFGLVDDISVMSVAQNRDIFVPVDDAEDQEEKQKAMLCEIASAVDEALDAYNLQREREGLALMEDLSAKLVTVSSLVDEIEELSAKDIGAYRARLEERLRRVLDEYGVKADESRILTECAIFADKVAVDEEVVRMRTHIKALYGFMEENVPVGRRFDFQLQELNREVNTTGSKCANTEIAKRVVALKAELEKIREQIQNVE